MGDSDDLFDLYRNDGGSRPALKGAALAAALGDGVRRTFQTIDGLCADVTRALAQVRTTTRLAAPVVDRSTYVQIDRSSESFREYLRQWSQQRADRGSGGMHWEAKILVTDHRRTTAEIGLGVAIEWPDGHPDTPLAFVEFWPTGQGVSLPADARGFQRALVACIVRLEQSGALASARPRTP
ncbi:hypothetical protein [Azospirillum halopraeferens]|uniref:hypothetical protein n=1 Tax=Azospirillum halopraeferens TaxID=34010 RepID=UPI000416753E|nr:hypothetical protein [Azospirillum halopraeferens]